MKDSDKSLDQDIVRFWEDRFPRRGEAFSQLLQPFYDWQPEVRPLSAHMGKQAPQAIFWRSISGIRILTSDEALCDELDDSLRRKFRRTLDNRVSRRLSNRLNEAFDASFWPRLQEWFKVSFEYRAAAPPALIRSRFFLWTTLFYPCLHLVANNIKAAKRYSGLHDFWLNGNFPMGFDQNEALLLHVADRKPFKL